MISGSPDMACSPSWLISQLADPSLVSKACHPFMHRDIPPESFCLTLASTALVPSMKELIAKNDTIAMDMLPTITKLLIDNLDQDGLNLVESEIIPSLCRRLLTINSKLISNMMELIAEVLSKIRTRYRDDVIVDVISKCANDKEPRMRTLAAYLIPLVRTSFRVLQFFRALSLDHVPQVRVEVIKSLRNCNFDDATTEYVLLSGTRDLHVQVRKTAASVYGDVCPQNVAGFLPLLANPKTTKSALKSMKLMVMENGFLPFYETFLTTVETHSEPAAATLLNLSRVVDESEYGLILDAAQRLRGTETLISHFVKFTEIFKDKDVVAALLDPREIKSWRTRRALLEQAMNFVGVIDTDKMIDLASYYAEDEVAIMRDCSVKLWTLLVKQDIRAVRAARQMCYSTYRSRLLLVKIAQSSDGVIFDDLMETLSSDPVSNVRYAVAVFYAKKYPARLQVVFGDCVDPDIIALVQEISCRGVCV